ncbi:MAG: hypothetical protein H6R24_2109, partial [Proteobacteria bacterium]|nr:hypothetical protein [Pseudomonadota bacterium]
MSANPQAICGCCTGIETATPQAVDNRPGLTAIAYRTGDHARFRQTLIARLAAYPQLAGLTSRNPDDFSIALLDACAVLADVLTFYQERIANEHYLPTATERRSALELGQLVGYRLRPGVAADVWLAFTLEAAQMPGSAPETTLQPGIRTQSIPGPGETAQSFETVEAVRARPEWNAMRPRLTRYQTFTHTSTELRLAGLATGLKPGDGLILTSDDQVSRLSVVTKLELRTDVQATLVGLKSVPVLTPSPPPTPGPTIGPGGGRPEVVGTLGGGVISRAVALTREGGIAAGSVSAFATAGTFTAGVGTGFGGVLNTT